MTRICPHCRAVVSVLRFNAHARSAACRTYARANVAEANLREVGGYIRTAQLVSVKLAGLGVRKVLAAGTGDLGDLTIVDDHGVRQYIAGEWSVKNPRDRKRLGLASVETLR